jgi:hypothetical protein
MSRARNIKPGFFKNEALAECEPMARLMFVGLWTLADRNGNLENRPKRLKGELFPYDNCDPAALLAQLISHGLVVEYEANGMALLNIPAFKAHQNPHMAEKPKYPEPGASTVLAPVEHGASRADSLLLIPESRIPMREARSRAHALPQDFNLTPDRETYARSKGVADPRSTFDHFRDHHTAKGTTLKDWDAGWRTWCRNEVTRFRPKGAPVPAAPVRQKTPEQEAADRARYEATLKAEADRAAKLAAEGAGSPRPDIGGLIGNLAASKRA